MAAGLLPLIKPRLQFFPLEAPRPHRRRGCLWRGCRAEGRPCLVLQPAGFPRCRAGPPRPPGRPSPCTPAMASVAAPVVFREFCPLHYLLSAIPAKVQKGFRSVAVRLTALDASGDYIAVGSSTGMLYLYCRRLGRMRRHSFEVSPRSRLAACAAHGGPARAA